MKTQATILFAAFILLFTFSCSKSDIEKGIDCVGESLFVKLKNNTDAANVKKVNFEIEYTGSNTFESVKWTFGDGTTETLTSKTVSHIYPAAGTFTVKADVTVKQGDGSCTSSPTRSITIN